MARSCCRTRREIPCGHTVGLVDHVNQVTRESLDDGDAIVTEGKDEITLVVKNKNANYSRIRSCLSSTAGSVVVAASPVELHSATIALLNVLNLSAQHTHSDIDSLVTFSKHCPSDAAVAPDSKVTSQADSILSSDIAVVQNERNEAVDPIVLLKHDIDEVKA